MKILFRNDDVRGTLDDSLIELTEAFIENDVPICHAIEPANITKEVVEWILMKKEKYPKHIEIVQHGYNHNLNVSRSIRGKLRNGEFGGNRGYDEQLADILEGKKLMDAYFGRQWFEAFSFPFGGRNDAAYLALSNAGYKVVNSGYSASTKHRLFYTIGKLLRKRFLLGKSVSYNLKTIPGTRLKEIDMCYGFIESYIDEQKDSVLRTEAQLIKKFNSLKKTEVVGIILHHRYHNSKEKIETVIKHILWLKSQPGIEFTTQECLYIDLL